MAIAKLAKSFAYDFVLNGKRFRKAGFKTKQEADTAETQARYQIISGTNEGDGQKPLTFEQLFLDYFLPHYEINYKASTYREISMRYKALIRFLPKLASMLLQHINIRTYDELVNNTIKVRTISTVRAYVKTVSTILSFARSRNFITSIPDKPKLPTVDKKKGTNRALFYTPEQQQLFLAWTYQHAPMWFCFWYLGMRLGIRKGEIFALKKNCITNDKKIVISQTVAFNRENKAVLQTRKNNQPYTIRVTPDVEEVIQEHQKKFCSEDEDYLYSWEQGWMLGYRHFMRKAQKELNLPKLNSHSMNRASLITNALAKNIPIKAIQEQVGHESLASTLAYVRPDPDQQLKVLEALGQPYAPPACHPSAIQGANRAGNHRKLQGKRRIPQNTVPSLSRKKT